ncbi:hypothetical protein TNCV_350141 [Trichonephila clavipes]|nr:hypothetical protein TNCV_350141 [Trichonephila clavipes]
MFDGMVAFAMIDGAMTAAPGGCGSLCTSGTPMMEGRFDLSTFHSVREYFIDHAKNDRHRVISQLASIDKNNALQEIKLRLSYLQGKSTTMSVIAHQTEKEWISVNKKSRQRMSQTQAEGAAEQHAARLEDAH